MRLREQLLLLTIGPLVAATVVYATLAWPATDRTLRTMHERDARQRLTHEADLLASGVERLQAQLDAMAMRPEFMSGSLEVATSAIAALPARIGDDGMSFNSPSGDLIHNGVRTSIRDREYFPDIQRGVPVVSAPLVSKTTGALVVAVIRPVRDATGRVAGAVGASIRIAGLLERVGHIAAGDHGFALLVDRAGHSLSSRNAPPAVANSFLDDTVGRGLGTMPDADRRALFAAMRSGQLGQRSIVLDGTSFTAFYQPVPELHWTLALIYRDDELLAERNRAAQVAIVVLLLGALVAAAAAFSVHRRIVRPVQELLAAQSAVAAGDLTRRASTGGPEELGELARSFNAMTEQLATEHEQLRSEIATRTEATAALAEQESLFREVFEASPSAIALIGVDDRRYRRVNAAFERQRGVRREDVIGRTPEEMGFARLPEQVQHFEALVRRDGEIANLRYSLRRSDGAAREMLLSQRRLTLGGEQLIISATIDISEQVKLEEQLRQSQKMEIVGQLAGGVAHDFNNMLAGIRGTAEVLDLELPAGSPLHELVALILDGATRAAGLTRQLLTFSRTQSTELRRLDIHLPVGAALDLMARTVDRRIEIRREFNARRSVVLGDSTLLQNVMLNLALNARDAMPDGGVLTVSTHDVELDDEFIRRQRFDGAPGRYVQVDVSDTGTGIASEVKERIFEPFFTTKAVGKGTGLGLSVAYATVTELRGSITVYSEVGRGTTFKLLIPGAVGGAERNRPTPAPALHGSGCVLLVDDEAIIRNMGSRLLASLGYEAITAADGEEGVALFRENRHRIMAVMLDLVMPKMDGRAAFHAIRAIDETVPVVLCSGFSTEATLVELQSHPRVQMLPKPYGRTELGEVLAGFSKR